VTTSPLVVLPDPGATATQPDFEAQFRLSLEMCNRRRTALSAVARLKSEAEGPAGRLRGWAKRLAALQQAVSAEDRRPNESELAAFKALDAELDALLQEMAPKAPVAGAGVPGASIQFDSGGVDFGPWLRVFIAQVKKSWNIPFAAMKERGHVVVTNPAAPLPVEYAKDRCFFTVTFYYNEKPPE
jgi:hypothetical protein